MGNKELNRHGKYEELARLTVVEAADAVRSGQVTSAELTEAAIAAFDERNDAINATIWLDPEAAREEAARLDARLKAGGPLGPLHGVPMAHKDIIYLAGRPCSRGSRMKPELIPDHTATALSRILDAGALTLGGLNTAEYAGNPTGHNSAFGAARNPWNPVYCSGGSSSGSGAAVSARCVHAALGTDTGGSVRLPAAICGVTGVKGTQTRVSRHGVMPLSFSLDNVGPLARTARDCARIMSVIAGFDPMDPTSAREDVPDYEAGLDGNLEGLRVGIPDTYFFDEIDADLAGAFDEAVRVLAERGARVVSAQLPVMAQITTYQSVVLAAESASVYAGMMQEQAQEFTIHNSARLYAGFSIPAVLYLEAIRSRGPLLREFAAQVFESCDVVLTPTLRKATPRISESDIDVLGEAAGEKFWGVSTNTRPFSYLGLPAVSVPCGFDRHGLPVGLQIVGRPFAEATILRLADAYQRDTDWHTRRPACAQ